MSNINILGTNYEYFIVKNAAPELEGGSGGITKFFEKKIFVNGDNDVAADFNRIVRHEIIHAFLFESGLSEYAKDEQIVDFLAYQIPKIVKIYKKLEINDDDLKEPIMINGASAAEIKRIKEHLGLNNEQE